MKHRLSLCILAVLALSCQGNLKYVDPLIGTEGEGTQYGGMMPCTGVPFGSAHWVPMTRLTEVSSLSYNESDSLLLGFIGTRQPAIWMGDWGQVSFQPQLDGPALDYENRGQAIEKEYYTPYYGEVSAGGIETKYSASEHSAVYEFSKIKHLVIDASRIAKHSASNPYPRPGHIEFSADRKSASGWNTDMFDGHHSSPKPNFRGYFYMEFSRPFEKCGCFGDGEDETKGYVTFKGEAPLRLRIGLSLISTEQAKENLKKEIGHKGVNSVASASIRKWKKKFDVLDIDADEDIKTIFYTGLYHSLLYPRQIDEYGRYYSAFDDKIHRGTMYNCFSMWDTYRAEHPLLTLVAPERVDGMMQSLVNMYREGGWLPKWPNPGYTGIMIGSPAETILAEAWTKGFRDFDLQGAYEAVKKNATVPQPNDSICNWVNRGCFGDMPETRGGLGKYQTIGYVAGDETMESVSRTQDFGLQDIATAILADAAGFPEEAEYFRKRSFNYKNLWNDEEKLFLPKSISGEWMDPASCRPYCECSPQTATWCIPYDIEGLSQLLGGDDEFEKKLDEYYDTLFWKPERGNKSVHGNEPSHHVAYMYNRIGHPEKTQYRVREIMSRSYSTGRKGFDGNEDCGQMSAWYILSAMGLYMLNPADGWYETGSPCIREARIKIGEPYSPAILHIRAHDQSPENVYVKKVTFNGKELKDRRIHHNELIKGGELEFYMTK